MNAQTQGPLYFFCGRLYTNDPGARLVAEANAGGGDATNRLIAAAYTAFDRAGRELGIDATELAKSLDLVGLIQSAIRVIHLADSNGYSDDLTVTGAGAVKALNKALSGVTFGPMGAD